MINELEEQGPAPAGVTAQAVPESKKGVILLCLDGGGIRGLSEVAILDELMNRIQYDSKPKLLEKPRPYQYFDLIGGTSTGGLVALMLGRLRMSTEDVMKYYKEIGDKVFSAPRGMLRDTKYDAQKLEVIIKDIVKNYGDPDKLNSDIMLKDTSEISCKTFVCAVPAHNVKSVHHLRSYDIRENALPDCRIWEAARATTAAPTFFKSMEIDNNGIKTPYYDGGLGHNNPTRRVVTEARAAFREPQRDIACIVSIGTGFPRVTDIPEPSRLKRPTIMYEAVMALKSIATDCEVTAEECEAMYLDRKDYYFRFSVEQGMQDVTLEEWKKIPDVKTHTTAYLSGPRVSQQLDTLVKILIMHKGR